jgi:uncharacterized membrane protein YkvA (DUF1232 family)
MSLKTIAADFRKQLRVYRAAAAHPRTPRLAKWCLVAALAYALMPFDLIPDFIPVVGHLDDLLIIPALVALALWMIPADVLAECRQSPDRALHT